MGKNAFAFVSRRIPSPSIATCVAAYHFRPHGIGSEVLSELWRSATGDGIAAGLAGAAAVAVWFLLYDSVTAVPLRTPALLSAWLFHGLRDPHSLVITAPLVLEYTIVHGVAFVVSGVATAWLLVAADREPRLMFVIFMLFCCFEVFAVVMIEVLSESLLDTITWWPILVGNALGAAAMIAVLSRHHRKAWQQFMAARL